MLLRTRIALLLALALALVIASNARDASAAA